MDELRIGQLTKEMVAEELRLLGDPCAAAAAVLRKTLKAALAPDNAARLIDDAVKGAMTALLLADQSMAKGAIMAMEAVLDAAAEKQVDNEVAMKAALKALSDLRRFVEPARIDELKMALEMRFMGTGAVFGEFLREPLPQSQKPIV